LILERHDACQEGAKHPIGPAQREHHIERFASREAGLPTFQHGRQRIGVMYRLPAPTLHLFRGGAGVFIPALVVPVDPAVGSGCPAQLWNRIGERAELRLAPAQRLFSPKSLTDVANQPEVKRFSLNLKGSQANLDWKG